MMRASVYSICLSLFLLGCVEPTVVQNYHDFLHKDQIATFEKEGFQFAVAEGRQWGDRLQVIPGKYMVQFRQNYTGIQGAVLCEVKAGGRYTVEITDRETMPRTGRFAYRGHCVQMNEKTPQENIEFEEEHEKQ